MQPLIATPELGTPETVIPPEESSEDTVTPGSREKRVRKSKLDALSKDFYCETSPSEIARMDEKEEEESEEDEDDDEDLGETIGYRYLTENSESCEESTGEGSEDDYSDLEDHVETGIPFPIVTSSCSKQEDDNNTI